MSRGLRQHDAHIVAYRLKVSDPEECRARLTSLVDQLSSIISAHQLAHSLSTDVARLEWFTGAAREHLATGCGMDRALGLTKGRGRPTSEQQQRLDLALRVHPLIPPKPRRPNWKAIARAVDYAGSANDLRKLYEAHFVYAEYAARVIGQDIADAMKEDSEKQRADKNAALETSRANLKRPRHKIG